MDFIGEVDILIISWDLDDTWKIMEIDRSEKM